MNIPQLLVTVRKYIWLILLITLAGGAVAYYDVQRQVPTYRASTTLALNPAAPNALVPYVPAVSAQSLVPTYIEFMRSQAFAALVVKELNLPDVNEDAILGSVSAQGVPNTMFFRISAVSTRPEYAQLFANTVAKVFIEQNTVQQQEQQKSSGGQNAAAQQQQQQLEDLRSRLQDEADYYAALIPSLRQQASDAQALPPSNDRDKQVLDLRAQLAQAQDADSRILTSLTDVESKLGGSAPTINTAIVVDEARLPRVPDASRGPSIMLLAVVVSFGSGVGLAIVLESLNNTFKTPEMLDVEYGVPTLGAIGVLDLRSGVRSSKEKLVTLFHPNSSAAEAFRSLRTNIQFAATSKPIRTLLITSAGPAEGKSLTAANLAVTFAQNGKHVVIVDLDLRRPSQHRVFGLSNEQGFTNLLLDENIELSACLQETNVPGLMVLTSGPLPPNPSEVLGSAGAAAILARLRQQADLVIVDSPPAVTVTDAAILASQVDAVMQVVAAGATRKDLVLRCKDVMARVGARIIGPVLNKVRTSDMGYYSYYYRQYRRGTPHIKEPVPVRQQLTTSGNGHAPEAELPEDAPRG